VDAPGRYRAVDWLVERLQEAVIVKFELPLTRDVHKVVVLTDEDSGSNEHMAYRIELDTDSGRWLIEGDHDGGPIITAPNGHKEIV